MKGLGVGPVYKGWSGVAGYFDGDGTVEFSIHEFVLKIRLAFDENWRPHLEALKVFLESRGIVCGSVRRKDGYNTWHVVVSNIEGVVKMAKSMMPYSTKKRIELQAVAEYYCDRITGDQFVQVMNGLVSLGERTGKNRGTGPPFCYSNGVLESRRIGEQRRASKRVIILPAEMVRTLQHEREAEQLTLLELSKRHGRSVRVIRRALGRT